MFLLIHGDNRVLSRNYLNNAISSQKRTDPEIIRLYGKKLDLTQLVQATESSSLFSQPKLIILEELFSHSSKTVKKQLITQLSSDIDKDISLIIWEKKRLTPSQLKPFKQFNIQEFKASNIVFKFLDSVFPQNQKNIINLYHRSVKQDSAEFTFYMLSSRIRDLISPEANKRLSSWQRSRLDSQKKKFDRPSLLSLHQKLCDIDWASKSGTSISDLQSELEFVLAAI